jgi:hypothetical protein
MGRQRFYESDVLGTDGNDVYSETTIRGNNYAILIASGIGSCSLDWQNNQSLGRATCLE